MICGNSLNCTESVEFAEECKIYTNDSSNQCFYPCSVFNCILETQIDVLCEVCTYFYKNNLLKLDVYF